MGSYLEKLIHDLREHLHAVGSNKSIAVLGQIENQIKALESQLRDLQHGMRVLSSVCQKRWDLLHSAAPYVYRNGLESERELYHAISAELDTGGEGTVTQ
jgi:hypothetical protein